MLEPIYIYGKLNKEIILRDYSGKDTDTANTIVDNANNTIEVNVKIDSELSDTSELPVQNKVIKENINNINHNISDKISYKGMFENIPDPSNFNIGDVITVSSGYDPETGEGLFLYICLINPDDGTKTWFGTNLSRNIV